MLKNIADSISNLTKLTLSAAQLALLLGILGGGWWAFSAITAFLSKPIQLPEVQVKLPNIGVPGAPSAEGILTNMDWKQVHFTDDAKWEAFGKFTQMMAEAKRKEDIAAGRQPMTPTDPAVIEQRLKELDEYRAATRGK